VAEKRTKKRSTPPPRRPEDATANERPTVTPPFDVEAFAREASAPSGNPLPPSRAPTAPPKPPEEREFESEAETQRVTLTNEVELERARARSAEAIPPPRSSLSSALSIANSRVGTSPNVPPLEPEETPTRNIPASSNEPPSSIEAAVLGAISGSSPPEITERTIEDPAAEMRERFSLGDYTGALEMSELILADAPDNLEAAECGENCRTVLENMYAARLGPLERVPMVIVPRTQMRWLSMDHRAGFVLSLIDGSSSVEMILDMSGMPKLDAYKILHELVQQKIVSFR
jgi:hypothetical protein